MSETDLVSTEAAPAPRKRGGLTGMVLAELRQLAGELNIPDIAGMRKGDLIAVRGALRRHFWRSAATGSAVSRYDVEVWEARLLTPATRLEPVPRVRSAGL